MEAELNDLIYEGIAIIIHSWHTLHYTLELNDLMYEGIATPSVYAVSQAGSSGIKRPDV